MTVNRALFCWRVSDLRRRAGTAAHSRPERERSLLVGRKLPASLRAVCLMQSHRTPSFLSCCEPHHLASGTETSGGIRVLGRSSTHAELGSAVFLQTLLSIIIWHAAERDPDQCKKGRPGGPSNYLHPLITYLDWRQKYAAKKSGSQAAITAGHLWISLWKRSCHLCVHCLVSVVLNKPLLFCINQCSAHLLFSSKYSVKLMFQHFLGSDGCLSMSWDWSLWLLSEQRHMAEMVW